MNIEDKLQQAYEIISNLTEREQLLLSFSTFMVDFDLTDLSIYEKIKPMLNNNTKWTEELIHIVDAVTHVLWKLNV